MNINDANMFDSRNLNLRLFTNALKLDKQVKDSYKPLLFNLSFHTWAPAEGGGARVGTLPRPQYKSITFPWGEAFLSLNDFSLCGRPSSPCGGHCHFLLLMSFFFVWGIFSPYRRATISVLFLFSEILPGHLEDTMGTELCKELQKTKEHPRICISCWKNSRIRIEAS